MTLVRVGADGARPSTAYGSDEGRVARVEFSS
jgi:hypothetical protein